MILFENVRLLGFNPPSVSGPVDATSPVRVTSMSGRRVVSFPSGWRMTLPSMRVP